MDLEKCFARKRTCDVTIGMHCDSCPLFKTQEQFNSDLEICWQRIRSLPVVDQRHISETYYKGLMPWYGDKVNIV